MRLNIHDFSGHPFQVQLSRDLARRGHHVVHHYSSQYITGHGNLELGPLDPSTLEIRAITADAPLIKYSPAARMRFELSYAKAWQRHLADDSFDLVLACNVPLFAMARMRRYFERTGQRWVFWHQDVYSLGIAAEARRRLPAPMATLASRQAQRLEQAQVASAHGVVAIDRAFLDQYRRWGISADHADVIPNWAPVADVVPGRRDNAWAERQGLPTAPVRLLYAGTLGRKHNPMLLVEMLDATRAKGVDAQLIVVSEGVGADDLAVATAHRSDVRILPYQPADDFGDVLASADVLLVLLERDAAEFSVPSKVLSYLCAGRPIVALVPSGNASAADVRAAGGFVGEPTVTGAREAGSWLAAEAGDPQRVSALGLAARRLAEERFDIDWIGDQFERLLHVAAGRVADLRTRRVLS
jgi:colanic acid biosynthesis glycosyl transferase WcaI